MRPNTAPAVPFYTPSVGFRPPVPGFTGSGIKITELVLASVVLPVWAPPALPPDLGLSHGRVGTGVPIGHPYGAHNGPLIIQHKHDTVACSSAILRGRGPDIIIIIIIIFLPTHPGLSGRPEYYESALVSN